jgi:serine/threonine protein kinase
MHLVAGTSLKNGQYILNHILDQQGIGWTYRATQTNLNQTVLIKTLNPTLRSHPQFDQICQDFIARSRDLSRLRHPSLVKVFDIFEDQNMPFVVMEYLQGISLNDWINDRPRSELEVIQFLRQMVQVLNYLQQHNYCHGNLNPRNIIYRSDSESKSESKSASNSEPSTVVLVGFAPSFVLSEMIVKRNPYSAPELRSGMVSDKSDLYSLSGILYYCLTQHPPLDSEADRLPLLSLLKPGAQRLLRSGTHLNPDDRPTSADLWLAQLSKSRPAAVKVSPATEIQQPLTSIQTPIQNTAIQTYQESPRSMSIDRSKTVGPGAALPENLPRYRTTPLMPSKTSNSDQNLAESMISKRVSMKRLPLPKKSYDRNRYNRSGSSLFLPKLRTVQIIGAVGIILGLIFGLVLRFQASQRPGASVFHTGQSFPPREWKGTTSPDDTNGNVFVEPDSAPIAPESSSESAQPQTPSNKPTAEPFSKNDAIVPAKRPESPSKDPKP